MPIGLNSKFKILKSFEKEKLVWVHVNTAYPKQANLDIPHPPSLTIFPKDLCCL